MATSISGLPSQPTPSESSLVPITEGGTSKSATVASLVSGTSAVTSLATAIDSKANLDAYDRSTHVGMDPPSINEQLGVSYILQLSDAYAGASVRRDSAQNNFVYAPLDSTVPFENGARVAVIQWGTGPVNFIGESNISFDVRIHSSSGFRTRAQYSIAYLDKQGTNNWLLSGDLAVGTSSGTSPFATQAPFITGTLVAGQTLTRTAGVWSGSPTPSVTGQWYADGVAISGQTGATYASANPGDAGKVISYIETASNGVGSPVSVSSNSVTLASAAATKPVNTTLPTITGTASVGNTLSATSGGWSNTPTTYKYVWKSNGATIRDSGFIAGATDSFLLTQAEAGTTVNVTVTAHNASGDTDVPAVSVGTPVTGALPSTGSSFPSIDVVGGGDKVAGCVLFVDTGVWLNNPTFSYQWYRASGDSDTLTAIGTNASTYQTTNSDADKTISCLLTGTTTGGSTPVNVFGVFISPATNAPVSTAAPTVSGGTTIGSVLTSTPGSWTNSPTFAYQWVRGTTNVGTNSSTYTTQASDGGGVMTCVVTATANGLSASATSSNSVTVSASGSGALSVASVGISSPYALDSVATVDWIVWPASTTPVTKSGGGALIGVTPVGHTPGSYAGPEGCYMSWTGGTPTASGSSDGTMTSEWGVANAGWDITFPVGTADRVVDIYMQGYNERITLNATLSDSSADPVSTQLDTPAGGASTTQYRFTVHAASAGQTLTVAIRTTGSYGAGNIQLRSAGIVS
jgi:hypothetical protein